MRMRRSRWTTTTQGGAGATMTARTQRRGHDADSERTGLLFGLLRQAPKLCRNLGFRDSPTYEQDPPSPAGVVMGQQMDAELLRRPDLSTPRTLCQKRHWNLPVPNPRRAAK